MYISSTSQKPADLKGSLRLSRLFHSCMIVACLFYMYLLYFLRHGGRPKPPALNTAPSASVSYIFLLVALLGMAGLLLIRKKLLAKAVPMLRQNTSDVSALRWWRTAMFVTSTVPMWAFLPGWVLFFIGTTVPWVAVLLWGMAATAFFVYFPQMPDVEG